MLALGCSFWAGRKLGLNEGSWGRGSPWPPPSARWGCGLWQLLKSAPPGLCQQWDTQMVLINLWLFQFCWGGLGRRSHTSPRIFSDCLSEGAAALPCRSWMESAARSAEESCSRSSLAPLPRLQARLFLLLVSLPGLKHQGNQNVCTVS